MAARAEVITKFSGDVTGLKNAVQQADKSISGLSKGALSTLGKTIAGAFAVSEIIAFAREAMRTADEIDNLSKRMGFTAESIQSIQIVAKEAGFSFEQFEAATSKLVKAQADAVSGNKEATTSFQKVGLSIEQIRGLAPEALFKAVAQSIKANEGSAEATSGAYKLFGETYAKMAGEIKGSLSDLDALIAKFKDLGLIVSNETNKALDETDETLSRLLTRYKNIGIEIVGFLAKGAEGWRLMSDNLSDMINGETNLASAVESQELASAKARAKRISDERKASEEKAAALERERLLDEQIKKEVAEQEAKQKIIAEQHLKKQNDALKEQQRVSAALADIAADRADFQNQIASDTYDAMTDEEKLKTLAESIAWIKADMATQETETVEGKARHLQLEKDLYKYSKDQEEIQKRVAGSLESQQGSVEKIVDKLAAARNVSIQIELPRLAKSMMEEWVKFINAVAGVNAKTEIKIELPRIADSMMKSWVGFINAIAGKNTTVAIGIDLPKMAESMLDSWKDFIKATGGKNVDYKVAVDLPSMSAAQIQNWKDFLDALGGGGMQFTIPSIPDSNQNLNMALNLPDNLMAGIPIDVSELERVGIGSIAQSLATLASLKGVIFA